ncbi:hypothetical protein [Micromonospora tarensis]|nr:hypothetical protein [Micromonospora tarensis]
MSAQRDQHWRIGGGPAFLVGTPATASRVTPGGWALVSRRRPGR